MPARRLVVAAASGVAILSMMISAPANAAKNPDDNGDTKKTDRTTTTEKHRTSTTEKDRDKPKDDDKPRTTTTERRHSSTTTTERKQAAATTTTADDEPADETTTSTTAKPVHTERYIVVLKKGNRSSVVAEEHARTRHVKVQNVFGHAVRGYAADIADNELDAIKKDKRVAYVERNKSVQKFAQTLPWGVERVSRKGDDWSSTRPGDGAGSVSGDVYVIDTGVQFHPDLFGGMEVNLRGGPDTDCDGHGTHMAGIVGAIDNTSGVVGVAPGVKVHGIKVLDCSGHGTDVNAIAGVDWVVANGGRPSVITMSFGGPISRAFDDAVKRAVAAGFTVITAAGNDHKNACSISPAHLGEMDGVITVGASTKRDRPASFSNFGPCVDMYAPGVQIPSYFLNGQLAIATGTSASAPHVAGVAALYLAGTGSDTPAAVEAAVKSHAVRVGNIRKPILLANSVEF
ncbi:MAG TPA: S8 family peptidase [Acidimicrobiales bacterium]|nr:S8 family peptidase [Acidimicrobiales bacterium]